MAVEYGSLPFSEAIDYLKGKVDLDTKSWTDIWEGQHAKAFTVAGATKDDVLTDLHAAINKAIEKGTTLAEFRKDFDAAVARTGWPYKGGRNWRTRIIYETNMRSAYQAGRYQQLQAVKGRRPYWQYKHSDFVKHPRPHHEAWNGLVLDADNPWWDTHYPPNGWGCRCSVRALSKRDLLRQGKDEPDEAPEIVWEEKTVGVRGPNPRTVQVPEGIDPGWGYNVGKTNTGQLFSKEEWNQWKVDIKGQSEWRPILSTQAADFNRPAVPRAYPAPAALTAAVDTDAEMITAITALIGGETKVYSAAGYPVLLDAQYLGEHVDNDRARFVPLLDDTLSDPDETWLNWHEHKKTGRVRLSVVLVKTFAIGNDGTGLAIAAEVSGGKFRAGTLFPTTKKNGLRSVRKGVLLQGKDGDS